MNFWLIAGVGILARLAMPDRLIDRPALSNGESRPASPKERSLGRICTSRQVCGSKKMGSTHNEQMNESTV
jgi:hypothetical protein